MKSKFGLKKLEEKPRIRSGNFATAGFDALCACADTDSYGSLHIIGGEVKMYDADAILLNHPTCNVALRVAFSMGWKARNTHGYQHTQHGLEYCQVTIVC
jgi:hypothetical protein